MATEELVPPGAQLMESMRAVGYSLSTAIADLVDNSIAAGATEIEIHFPSTEDAPYVAILDDGSGMSADVAREAMRLAGGDPARERLASDLGRFGLGLKTASLSQCRRMTVLTIGPDGLVGLCWDIDHIRRAGSWSLLVLDASEAAGVPESHRLLGRTHGTLVVWERLDSILNTLGTYTGQLDQAMIDVRDHLSLVFHQFLIGDFRYPRVSMSINGTPVAAADPFLAKSPRTVIGLIEPLDIAGARIEIQPFTLPYLNKMTSEERRKAGVVEGLRDSQGFYIYRGGRLLIWGTWFRLLPKGELSKLTRVKVDIPNSLDHLWSLDIKKSSAVPPYIVRERLRLLAGSMVEPSNRIHKYRGRKPKSEDDLIRAWDLIEDRDSFRYEINRDHPVLARLVESLDEAQIKDLESALEVVEATFPVQDLHNRMSSDRVASQDTLEDERLIEELAHMATLLKAPSESLRDFLVRSCAIEPWQRFAGRVPEIEPRVTSRMARDRG